MPWPRGAWSGAARALRSALGSLREVLGPRALRMQARDDTPPRREPARPGARPTPASKRTGADDAPRPAQQHHQPAHGPSSPNPPGPGPSGPGPAGPGPSGPGTSGPGAPAPERTAAHAEAERRLRLALSASAMGVWETEPASGRAEFDAAARRLLGLPEHGPVTRRQVLERVHPDDRERCRRVVEAAQQAGGEFSVDFRLDPAAAPALSDGLADPGAPAHERWLSSRAAVVREPGVPERLVGVVFDVTAERALRRREREALERLRLALDAGGMGTWSLDLRTGHYEADEAEAALIGRPGGGAMTPEEVWSLIHPDDHKVVREAHERTLQGLADYASEFRVLLPEGGVRWLAGRGRVIVDGAGAPALMLGVNFDVTQRRQQDERLDSERRLLDAVLEAMPVAVFIADAKGETVRINSAARRLWGDAPSTASTADWHLYEGYRRGSGERLGRDDWPMGRALRGEVIAGEEIEVVPRAPDGGAGERRVSLVSAAPVRDASGRVVAAVATQTDVTERVRAEERLRAGEEALRRESARRAYLLELSDALRPLGDAVAVAREACRVLARAVGADRVLYFRVEGDEYIVDEDCAEGAPSIVGRYHVDSFGETLLAQYRAGRTAVSDDAAKEAWLSDEQCAAFAALGIGAYVGVPLIKDGRFVGGLAVHARAPRAWSEDEVALAEETAHRAWEASERARAEKALRDSEERMRLSQDAGRVGTWDFDVTNQRMHWSDAMWTLYGRERGAAPPERVWDEALHPDDLARVQARARAMLAPGGEDQFTDEFRVILPDGSQRWLEVTARVTRAPGGAASRMYGVNVDVTARKRAADALARYRLLWERTRDPIIFVRPGDWRVLDANRAAEDAYGHTREELLALTLRDLRHPSTHAEIEPQLRRADAQGLLFETTHVRKDGTPFPVEVNSRGVDLEGERVVVSVVRDISERRAAEEELRRREERLRVATEGARVGVWEQGDGWFTCTPMNLEMFGFDPGAPAPPPEAFLARIHPEDRARVVDAWSAVLLNGLPASADYRVLIPASPTTSEAGDPSGGQAGDPSGGQLRWLHSRSVTAPEGAAARVVGATFDITERKRAEEALAEREQLLRTVIDSTPDPIWAKDAQGRLTLVNKSLRRLLGGVDDAGLLGKSAADLAPETAQAKRIEANDRRVMESGETIFVEEAFGPPGAERVYESVKSPLRDASGAVVGLVGVSRDVTEHRRQQDDLRRSEERYRAIVETQTEMICRYRPEGVIIFANDAYARAVGRTRAQMEGFDFWSFIPEAEHEKVRALLARLTPDAPEVRIENRVITPAGERWTLWVNRALAFDESGRCLEAQATGLDITERRQAEEEVRRQRDLVTTIAENTTSALFMMNEQGLCTYANSAALAMTGLTRPRLAEAPLHELIHHHRPDGTPYPKHECPIDRALPENFDVRAHEDVFFRADGSPFPVVCAASPVFDGGRGPDGRGVGRPVSTVIEVRDVTAEHAARDALLASQERAQRHALGLRALAESAAEFLGGGEPSAADLLERLRETARVDACLRFDFRADASPAPAPALALAEAAGVSDELRASYAPGLGLGQEVCGLTARDRAEHYAPRLRERTDDATARLRAAGLRAYVCLPLEADGVLLGTLSFGSSSRDELAPEELDLLRAAARQFAAALGRRRAERALRESEERLRLALDAGRMGTWSLEVATGLYTVDDAERELFGLAPGNTFTIESVWDFVHPEDRGRVHAAVARAIERDERYESEFRVRDPAGGWRWLGGRGRALRDAGGNPATFVGVNYDITEARQAAERLRESEERYRALFAGIEDGFCVVEVLLDDAGAPRDYRILYGNPAFAEHTGLRDAFGRTVLEIGPSPEPWAPWIEAYGRVALTGEPARFERYADALQRWYDVYAFRFGAPERREVAIFFKNVTARRHAEERDRYLLALADALRPLSDPVEVQAAACRVLGEKLGASRSMYSAASPDGETIEVARDWCAEGVPSVAGVHRLAGFGAFLPPLLQGGEVVGVPDVARDERFAPEERAVHAGARIGAFVAVPLVKDRRLVGILSVHAPGPRDWTEEDLRLIRETAERTWAALERALAQEALRVSESRLRAFFKSPGVGMLRGHIDGRVLECNDEYLRTVGRTRADMDAGLRWDDITPPEWLALDALRIAQARERGWCDPYEKEYLRPDGTRVPVLLSYMLLEPEREQSMAVIVDISERKRVERALDEERRRVREAYARLRLAMAAGGLGAWVWDMPSGEVMWDGAVRALWGRPELPESVPQAQVLEAVHPDDLGVIRATMESAAGHGGEYATEFRVTRPDGTLRWVGARGSVETDASGAIVRASGVNFDVTDRKLAERALLESMARFRAMADSAPALVWMSDTTGACVWFNRVWLEFTGRAMDDVLGHGWTDDVHPEDYERCVGIYTEHFRAREGFVMEYRLRRADGQYRWLLDRGVPRYEPDGSFAGFIGTCVDIHGRVEAERGLIESEDRFRSLAESVPQMISVAEGGRVVFTNRRLREYVGADGALTSDSPADRHADRHADPPADPFAAAVHPDDRERVAALRARAWAGGLSQVEWEMRVRDARTGAYRRFLCRAVPEAGDDAPAHEGGGPGGGAGSGRVRWLEAWTDIEEAMRTQDRLRDVVEDLRRANADLEDFAYIAAHDLREPIRGVRMYASFLAEDHAQALGDAGLKRLSQIESMCARTDELAVSLLTYAQAGRAELTIEELDAGDVVREAVELLRPALEEHAVDVRLPRPFPRVRADRARLAEVFRNLIANAARYNDKPRRWLSVSWREDLPPGAPDGAGPGPVFCVADNGVGIPPEHQGMLFRMFKRLHAPERFGRGTGAGLALVKRIVERHGGRVWAESLPDAGSTFFFTLGTGKGGHSPEEAGS